VIEDQPFLKWAFASTTPSSSALRQRAVGARHADEYGAGDWIFDGETCARAASTPTRTSCSAPCSRTGPPAPGGDQEPHRRLPVLGIDVRSSIRSCSCACSTSSISPASIAAATTTTRASASASTTAPSARTASAWSSTPRSTTTSATASSWARAPGAARQDHGKFGDPAAGGSLAWARTRFSF